MSISALRISRRLWRITIGLSLSESSFETCTTACRFNTMVLVCFCLLNLGPLSSGPVMWGIFGKPLKRAIWNTLGLHAVLTTYLRFSVLAASFCQQAATMST